MDGLLNSLVVGVIVWFSSQFKTNNSSLFKRVMKWIDKLMA